MGYWYTFLLSLKTTSSEWREVRTTLESKKYDWISGNQFSDQKQTIAGSLKYCSPDEDSDLLGLLALYPMLVCSCSAHGEEAGDHNKSFLCGGHQIDQELVGSMLGNEQGKYLRRRRKNNGICAGVEHLVALMPNGKIAVDGTNRWGECCVLDWMDIVDIDCGESHTVGMRADGHVVACGSNVNGQCNVNDLGGKAKAISCGRYHTAILLENGRVILRGHTEAKGNSITPGWKSHVVFPVKTSPSSKVRAQVNERMEHVKQGDTLLLKRNVTYIDRWPAFDVMNCAGEYLGLICNENTLALEGNLDTVVITAAEAQPLSKNPIGRKTALLTVEVSPGPAQKTMKMNELPCELWPPVEKIVSLYDAVIGITAQGDIYVDGYQPFGADVIMEFLVSPK